MTRLLSLGLCLSFATACSADDADTSTGADAAPPAAATCSGGDRMVLTGAFSLDTSSVGMTTLGGNIIGAVGSANGDLYAFSVRDVIEDDLHDVGEIDVADVPIKHIVFAPGVDCDEAPAGACQGFYALAGTYTVIESGPRYRASFELTDLFERHDNSNELGDAIPGLIEGCIDSPMP